MTRNGIYTMSLVTLWQAILSLVASPTSNVDVVFLFPELKLTQVFRFHVLGS